MSKDDLINMRDDMAANGDSAAEGITLAIENFDSADTDQDGQISFEEMQAFAEANGISMPEPGKGKPPQAASSDGATQTIDMLMKLLQQQVVQAYNSSSTSGSVGTYLGAGLTA
jgi:hypothetical protein